MIHQIIVSGKIYKELEDVYKRLEEYYNDLVDLEFTIEDGKLYML